MLIIYVLPLHIYYYGVRPPDIPYVMNHFQNDPKFRKVGT